MIRKLGGWAVLIMGLSPLATLNDRAQLFDRRFPVDACIPELSQDPCRKIAHDHLGQETVVDKQDVPSEREGKLLFVGVELLPGDSQPQGRDLEKEIAQGNYCRVVRHTLVTELSEGEDVPAQGAVTIRGSDQRFRPIERGEQLVLGRFRLAAVEVLLRRLEVGEAVRRDQLLAMVDPKRAEEDLAIKITRLMEVEAEHLTAERPSAKARERLDLLFWIVQRRCICLDVRAAERNWLRCLEVEKAKAAAARAVAEQELRASFTRLRKYEVRADVAGIVTTIYRKPGERVRMLDPILQIQVHERRSVGDVAAKGQAALSLADGKLLFLGVEEQSGKHQPQGLELEKAIAQGTYSRAERFFLVTEVSEGEKVPDGKVVSFPDNCKKKYRPIDLLEGLHPNRVRIARTEVLLRKLEVGQKVQRGQVVAMIDPALAVDELAIKAARFADAEADRMAAERVRDETRRHYDELLKSQLWIPGSVEAAEVSQAEASWLCSILEVKVKAAALRQAEQELRACMVQMGQLEMRADQTGVVTEFCKGCGDAVKRGEPLLRILSPDR